jgi:hypothetical protein
MERIKLNNVYTERWFRLRPKLNWRTEIVCDAIWQTFGPFKSIVDLGCAIGEFIAHFSQVRRIFAVGFEGSENSLTHMALGATIYLHDLRSPLEWGVPKFDVCMCLEVAEHIEPEYADTLVSNCCVMSNVVLFTAARPGQEGLCHVNCQPPEYWCEKFARFNFYREQGLEFEFKQHIEDWKSKKGIKAYYDNALVFKKWT